MSVRFTHQFPVLPQFVGKRQQVRFRDIRTVELVRQPLPWKLYLIVNAILLVLVFVWGLRSGWRWMVGALAVLVVANALGRLVASQTKWIRIEHGGASEPAMRSYFADRRNDQYRTLQRAGVLAG